MLRARPVPRVTPLQLRSSHIGKQPIAVPSSVTVSVNLVRQPPTKYKGPVALRFSQLVSIEGPLGSLSMAVPDFVKFTTSPSSVEVLVADPSNKVHKAFWGTMRALTANHVAGVSEGHLTILRLVGTGYRAVLEEKDGKPYVTMKVGALHPQGLFVPEGVKASVPVPTRVVIEGCDKRVVNQFAHSLRAFRPPEPYKGKGVFVGDETIKIKDKKIK